MEPRIEWLAEKKLIGKKVSMSLEADRTFELWSSFMPRRKEVTNQIGTDLFCLQIYEPSFNFKNFDPSRTFIKWAAVEVTHFTSLPKEMEPFTLQGGLYAVFLHIGAAATAANTFRNIFETWLPNADFEIDSRPHFEILGSKYKNNDPASEEEVWIPVRPKK